MNDSPIRIQCQIRLISGAGGRKRIVDPEHPASPKTVSGRTARASRLMALAIHFDELLRSGVVADYAELAQLGHVSNARISQVMNLLTLAPDIQEAILFLPHTVRGRDPIRESHLRPLTAVPDWREQRRLWRTLAQNENGSSPMSALDAAAKVLAETNSSMTAKESVERGVAPPGERQ